MSWHDDLGDLIEKEGFGIHTIHAKKNRSRSPQDTFDIETEIIALRHDLEMIEAENAALKFRVEALRADSSKTIDVLVEKNRLIYAAQHRIKVLREALGEANALNINWTSEAEPEQLAYYSEYRKVISMGEDALATPDNTAEIDALVKERDDLKVKVVEAEKSMNRLELEHRTTYHGGWGVLNSSVVSMPDGKDLHSIRNNSTNEKIGCYECGYFTTTQANAVVAALNKTDAIDAAMKETPK